jgi:hypothetical protein
LQTPKIDTGIIEINDMQELCEKGRAGDGIRTHGIPPWEGGALPLGDTRLGEYFIEIERICQ